MTESATGSGLLSFLAEGYIGGFWHVSAGCLHWAAGLGVAKAAPLFGAWLAVAWPRPSRNSSEKLVSCRRFDKEVEKCYRSFLLALNRLLNILTEPNGIGSD